MHRTKIHQRGATTLLVTLVLFFVMTLIAAFASRNLIFEQKTAVNRYRAALAFEAAEAGIEWAIAMLNNPQAIGLDCLRGSDPGDASFRDRYLRFDASDGMRRPVTWDDAGTPAALQAACLRDAEGLNCSCPAKGLPRPAASATTGPHPAFSIQFSAGPQAGTLRLVARGCRNFDETCRAGNSAHADATAQVEVLLGFVGGLASLPAAPLTVKGQVDVGAAAIGLLNTDAWSGGLTLLAGGDVTAPNARMTTAAGGSAALAWVERDAALNELGADRLFATFFGVDKPTWKDQSTVTRFTCEGDCGAALARRIGSPIVNRQVWIDGDLQLDGPIAIGTADRPVTLVVSGDARISGAVAMHGLVYASNISWNQTAGGGATLQGAAVSEGSYRGDGAPDLLYHRGLLLNLQQTTGSFVRIPGSWKDF